MTPRAPSQNAVKPKLAKDSQRSTEGPSSKPSHPNVAGPTLLWQVLLWCYYKDDKDWHSYGWHAATCRFETYIEHLQGKSEEEEDYKKGTAQVVS